MQPSPTSIQRQQTKNELVNPQGSLNYELGKAVRSLPPLYTRFLVGGICLAVSGTITWAAFSKVDEVAVAPGQVIPSTQVQPMRSLTSGLIREIKVTEGQHIQRGDILLQLDPTTAQAEVERLEKLVRQGRDTLSRLEAERTGHTQVAPVLQNQLLASRLKEFRDRRAAAVAETQRQRSALSVAQVQLSRLQSDLQYAGQKAEAFGTLLHEGAVPRFDYLDARNKTDTLQTEIAAQVQTIHQAEQAYQAAQKNVDRLEAERQSEILTQINQQQQEITDLEGKLAQAQDQRNHNTIRAAVPGIVYNVKVTKAGAGVQPGEELLSILPDGEDLLLEAKVQNQDIGFVRSGMRVKVKLATFPYQEFGMVEGMVSKISPNAVNEQNQGLVFPVQIQFKQKSVWVKGREVPLTPGMAATGEIVTRQKTVLSFLLDPITASWDQAFSIR